MKFLIIGLTIALATAACTTTYSTPATASTTTVTTPAVPAATTTVYTR